MNDKVYIHEFVDIIGLDVYDRAKSAQDADPAKQPAWAGNDNLAEAPDADLCLSDPGFGIDLTEPRAGSNPTTGSLNATSNATGETVVGSACPAA